ncbi:MAG: helix-turn-helix domain-containing protein [Proteobacteria bacterium]|nr:helix-turn-helix domain-containing protein [Pseudomonadota bacterium]MBU1389840.1 helix-turn-helix domain-containing protein [Pseudomonadota bacterium]MBU1543849.1 helix-turn-helix domain-containing protein [Pseudomonadota bacterium]MBU2481132.1 helix-turn-helix domain-containing protein [Pseudomonadota bacterium]
MGENKVDVLINRIFEATGISSQSELADELEINRSGITHARNNNKIPDKWIVKLYKKFSLNPQWIETGVGNVFMGKESESDIGFKHIPKVAARLSAGTGSFDCDENITDYLSFSASWLSKKGSSSAMVAMEVFGQSMEPVIREGDTVLIDQSQKQVLAGAIYAVGVDDTILVKRLEKHPNKLVLCSDNKNYDPIYLEKEDADKIRIIGKVIWSCREYR